MFSAHLVIAKEKHNKPTHTHTYRHTYIMRKPSLDERLLRDVKRNAQIVGISFNLSSKHYYYYVFVEEMADKGRWLEGLPFCLFPHFFFDHKISISEKHIPTRRAPYSRGAWENDY